MPRFRVPGVKKGYVAASSGTSTAITYRNPGMGTSFDSSTGFITFGLRSGAQRVWLNGGAANDLGDGLTAATARKTLAGVADLYLSQPAGSQLMIAEGYTYTDTLNKWWTSFGGFSATYPNAALSYDPADAANSAKYGRATGANMPVWSVPDPSTTVCFFAGTAYLGTANNYAIQGIAFTRPLNGNVGNCGWSGPRSNICIQNCRYQNVSIGFQADAGGGTTGSFNTLISKSSFYGQNDNTGNTLAAYVDWTSGQYWEDCVFYHCGWKIGASRSDAAASGGTSDRQHDVYFHASNVDGHFNRIMHIDCANDATNYRGDVSASQIVCWDVPISLTLGGFSTGPTVDGRPGSVLVTVSDVAVIGGARINDNAGMFRNWLIQNENLASGSYAKNIVAFDSPYVADNTGCVAYCNNSAQLIATSYLLVENLHEYNYSYGLHGGGGAASTRQITYKDSYVDSFAEDPAHPQTNTVFTNTSLQNGAATYPSKITRTQFTSALCTAMGLTPGADYAAQKKQIVDMMIYRPDISWAPIVLGITHPAYSCTPTYATATAPNMSAVSPPSIYV